jgi:2-polyprenyl-3-methyl-5-hydroxy-6-metoxy-1,4-benzoquinol methylase
MMNPDTITMLSQYACHVSGKKDLVEIISYRKFFRVTSDCKIWRAGGSIAIGKESGTVQAIFNDQWQNEIAEIYKNYTIYFQANGVEQSIFNPATGEGGPRSSRLLQQIKDRKILADNGRFLDIGCGNGSFLKPFSTFFPEWNLSGTEWDGKYQDIVDAIPGFETLYTGPTLDDVSSGFDAISLNHVFEHIGNPINYLKRDCH